MKPDPTKRQAVIRITVKDGQIKEFYERELILKEGTIGELIVPAYAVLNKELLKTAEYRTELEILPKHTRLMVSLDLREPEKVDKNLIKKLIYLDKSETKSPDEIMLGYFAEIILLEPLLLHLRGTKKAQLIQCKCDIPALRTQALSLNQAYTLLSQMTEIHRMSHSGNVFKKILFMDKDNIWKPLELYRRKYESRYERQVLMKSPSDISNLLE